MNSLKHIAICQIRRVLPIYREIIYVWEYFIYKLNYKNKRYILTNCLRSYVIKIYIYDHMYGHVIHKKKVRIWNEL